MSSACLLNSGRVLGHKAMLPNTPPEEISDPEALSSLSEAPCPTSNIEWQGHTTSLAADRNDKDGNAGEKRRAQIFACPYLRYDPVRHKSCLNLRLKRIRDVKQHLQRRHCPQFECLRCYQTFTTRTRVHEHVRLQLCELREPPTGSQNYVSHKAQGILKRPASRKDSPEEQWCKIWETLFPDRPIPNNACLGSVVDEGLGMIRQFWVRQGSSLVSKHLDLLQCRRINGCQLDRIVMRLLDDACGQLKQEVLESEGCDEATHHSMEEMPEEFTIGLLENPEWFGKMVDEAETLLAADQTTRPEFTHCTKGSFVDTADNRSLPPVSLSLIEYRGPG